MKAVGYLIFAISIALCSNLQLSAKLYPAFLGNKWGYIDTAGTMVIPPRFHAASRFNEGYAAVRLNGTYGYIDSTGAFVIEPQFDYAHPFHRDLAKVYIDGRFFFIDKEGRPLFHHPYRDIQDFDGHTYAIVITALGRYGVIDREGNLIVDTLYRSIDPFVDGVAVVTGPNHKPNSKKTAATSEAGVIDTSGNWIVPFGTYRDICTYDNGCRRYNDGYAIVELTGSDNRQGVIDTRGNLLFEITQQEWKLHDIKYFGRGVHHGLLVADTYSGKGIVDISGKLITSDTSWQDVVPFSFTTVFVQKKGASAWLLLDIHGRQLTQQSFDDIFVGASGVGANHLFEDGLAIVRIGKEYGTIDTTGRFVAAPRTFDFSPGSINRIGDIAFMATGSLSNQLYGYWNIRTNTVVTPDFQSIDMDGFDNELIQVIYRYQPAMYGYINHSGRLVWSEEPARGGRLNIDFQQSPYYRVRCARSLDLPVPQPTTQPVRNRVQVILDTSQHTTTALGYRAIMTYILNRSPDAIDCPVSSGQPDMFLQAMDKDGEWKDIETHGPGSVGCGSSLDIYTLDRNTYWEIPTPMYDGGFRTRIRIKFIHLKNADFDERETVYSNEIEGYVNPAQFWRLKYPYTLEKWSHSMPHRTLW